MRLETGSCLLLQNVSFAYNMVKQVCYYLHSLQSYVTLLKKVVVQFYPDFSNTTAGWFELKQGTPFPVKQCRNSTLDFLLVGSKIRHYTT